MYRHISLITNKGLVQSQITWDENSSRRFLDASVYSGFHKALARKIIPYLYPDDTLCDIGCGLGRLDLELAPHVSEILAIDVSEYAVNTLKRDANRAGLKNISVRCGDAAELTSGFDVILLSLFGIYDTFGTLGLCRRRFIRIVSASKKSGLYPERHRREVKDAVPLVQNELDAQGIEYKLELCSFEFGQPLRTWQDAASFVLSNAPEAGPGEIDIFLDENIERTGRGDFPYYLPYLKELGIFIIDK